MQPVAFMVVGKEHIKLLPANSSGMIERIIEMTPQVIDEIHGVVKKCVLARNGLKKGTTFMNESRR